jgi:hypothetical protein
MKYDFKPEEMKSRELYEKLQATSTTTPGVSGFGGRVFIKPKKRKWKKKKMEEINYDKIVLEKTFNGEDCQIEDEKNVLLAEKYNDVYYIYDVLKFDGKCIMKEPWYKRIQFLKQLILKIKQKEKQ